MDTDKAIINIYNMTYRLNGRVAALEESINSLSERIEESNRLHTMLKEEHERELNNLKQQVRSNTEFVQQAKGVVKLIALLVSMSVVFKLVLTYIL